MINRPTSKDIDALRRKIKRLLPNAQIKRTRRLPILTVSVDRVVGVGRPFCLVMYTDAWRVCPDDDFPLETYLELSNLIANGI